jgi:hypothetical protein
MPTWSPTAVYPKAPEPIFTGNHLAGVEADTHPKIDAVALFDGDRQGLGFPLNTQRGQTRPQRVVLQSGRRAE